MNKKPPQNSQQYQRVGAGQYRMGNGPIVNAQSKAQLPQPKKAPMAPPQSGAPQAAMPGYQQAAPQGQFDMGQAYGQQLGNAFNPGQAQQLQNGFDPQRGQQLAQQYAQFQGGNRGPFPGGAGYGAQIQGNGSGWNPQQSFDQAAQQNQIWRKTQAPDQAMGILAGMPPGYNQRG